MSKIICIGEALIDFIGQQPGTLLKNQDLWSPKIGGAPLNVACVASALGSVTQFIGSVGNDGFGEAIKETLMEYGVDLTGVQEVEAPTTLAFVSLDPHGEREFVFNRGADAFLDYNMIHKIIDKDCAIWHFGSATALMPGVLQKTYKKTWEYLKANNVFLSFDPNYRSVFWGKDKKGFQRACQPFMAQADLVKLSEEEALLLAERDALVDAIEVLKQKCNGVIVITLGANGAWVFNQHWKIHVPTKPVKVVDSTGAGDGFIAAFLHQLSKEDNLHQAVKDVNKVKEITQESNHIGAIICTEKGALTAIKAYKNL